MMADNRRNPNVYRWVALVGIVVGFGLLILDAAVLSPTAIGGSMFRPRGPVGYAALALIAVVLVVWLVVYFTTRCPFCGRWIDAWYYPRPGHHCPKCGRTNGPGEGGPPARKE